MWGLTKEEVAVLKKLSTPVKIQNFLDTLPFNHEERGETHMSPRRVLQEKKAHCIEGALFAATALWFHGQKPLLLDLTSAKGDDDHVIALYKQNGYFGAISKTNHSVLRFRDPIYKTIRELALSYFHEWFLNTNGKKMLRSYGAPLYLRTLGTNWITSEEELWYIDKLLDEKKHFPLVPSKNKKYLRPADSIERKAGSIVEWKKK